MILKVCILKLCRPKVFISSTCRTCKLTSKTHLHASPPRLFSVRGFAMPAKGWDYPKKYWLRKPGFTGPT